ncbi:Cg2 protein, putative [Plasmodium gallinaceum]|uniref:Mediator of RNA polymerase II transcription subunit 14 n=1 Tax=Plasmodium gallinaceum TaxID=5849 RepID=A0A1J1H025_PLAGA|nr:Cg2 protein, putative [Plasmodium gallinaceum]CRG98060.1 Cg2 protein, putative [Plasmodium gallinaceum]
MSFEENDEYEDYKDINYGLILKKIVKRSINDWHFFCERVHNDNGENYDYLRSALIQYCRHMRECFLKLLELDKFRDHYKEIIEIIKYIFELKENYQELKTKYQYDLYLCKIKTISLQLNENNILCAMDCLSTKKYTRFPSLFKQILKSPTDFFLPELDMHETRIVKKRITDEFLINYYISKIPKKKVNFIFSNGLIEMDIINEVKIFFISDFLNWKILKVDILFLNNMNLHPSHNFNLINMINYSIIQKKQQNFDKIISRINFKKMNSQGNINIENLNNLNDEQVENANHITSNENMDHFSKNIIVNQEEGEQQKKDKHNIITKQIGDEESEREDKHKNEGNEYEDEEEQEQEENEVDEDEEDDDDDYDDDKETKYEFDFEFDENEIFDKNTKKDISTKNINVIENYYIKESNKGNYKDELMIHDILYEIYRICHFYCSKQILEFIKGCINNYNSFNYNKKKFQIYKLFKNKKIEFIPSCSHYNLNDDTSLLNLDIHLYDFELTKQIYNFFEKVPLINKNSQKKVILKFVLNSVNGNIKVFLWPFSYFKKKENYHFDNLLSYYEFCFCIFLREKIKKIFVYNPLYIHIENWLVKVTHCISYFLFSILKIFCTNYNLNNFFSAYENLNITDYLKSSENSFENNITNIHELVLDYFFDIYYIKDELKCIDENKMEEYKKDDVNLKFDNSKEVTNEEVINQKIINKYNENNKNNKTNNNIDDNYVDIKSKLKIIKVKKPNGKFYILRYTFYEQKIDLFINMQNEKFIFKCHWDNTFINIISLNYNLKLIIYIIYLLKYFSLFIYFYNSLKKRFININPGKFFDFHFKKKDFYPSFFFHKLKLYDFLKKYDYSSNIILTKFLEQFFSLIDFYFYLYAEGNVKYNNNEELEKNLKNLIKKDHLKSYNKKQYQNNYYSIYNNITKNNNECDNDKNIKDNINNGSIDERIQSNVDYCVNNNENNNGSISFMNIKAISENDNECKKKSNHRNNFFSIFYYTIYINNNTPLLLCMLLEKNYIFATYIILSFENNNKVSKKENEINYERKNKKNFFLIPLIHKKYSLNKKLDIYFDSIRDLINNFLNMFIILYNISKVNFYCQSIFSFFNIVEDSIKEKKEDVEHSMFDFNNDVYYNNFKSMKNKNALDLQYFISKYNLNHENDINFEYSNDYIDNYILDLHCSLDEYFINNEYVNKQRKDTSFLIKIHKCGSLFFKIPIKEKTYIKINNFDINENSELQLFCGNIVVNMRLEKRKKNNNNIKQTDCNYIEDNSQNKLNFQNESKFQEEKHEWILLKKIYVVVKDEFSSINILNIFSVIIKTFLILSFSNELYYAEKIFSNYTITNCHLSNIHVLYFCNYNKDITCSVDLNILNNNLILNEEKEKYGYNYEKGNSNVAHIKEFSTYNDKKNVTLTNHININEPNYFNYLNYEDLLKNLLFIDITFNCSIDCINKIFLTEKKNFYIYLKKNRSIFNTLKFICLTFEFHHSFYILINKTNDHLNKINFLNQVNQNIFFDFHYENILTVNLKFNPIKIDNDILSFYIIIDPEFFSKVIIIPYFNDSDKNEKNKACINKFFKREKVLEIFENYFSKLRINNNQKDEFEEENKIDVNKLHNIFIPPRNNIKYNLNKDNDYKNLKDSMKVENNDMNDISNNTNNIIDNKNTLNNLNNDIKNLNNNLNDMNVNINYSLNTFHNNIIIDNLDEEDIFIYLFLNFCNLINLKGDKYKFCNLIDNEDKSYFINDNINFNENIDEKKLFENELKIFEEYDMFISNIKYILKIKNKIILSEINFFPPLFFDATLCPFIEFLRTLKVWLILIEQLKVHYTNITLKNDFEINNVFQYITALKKKENELDKNENEIKEINNCESKGELNIQNENEQLRNDDDDNKKNECIFIHIFWFIYNIKTLYLDEIRNNENQKSYKRNYETLLSYNKEYWSCSQNDNNFSIEGEKDEIKSLQHKKLKIKEEIDVNNNNEIKTDKMENNEKSKNVEKCENIKILKEKKYSNISDLLKNKLDIKEIDTNKLKYLINAYSYNSEIFLKIDDEKKNFKEKYFIEKTYYLRILKLKNMDDLKSCYKSFKKKKYFLNKYFIGENLNDNKIEFCDENINNNITSENEISLIKENNDANVTNINEHNTYFNNNLNILKKNTNNVECIDNNKENIELSNFNKLSNLSKNINENCIRYLSHSISIYFENVGENVDEDECWFYCNTSNRSNNNNYIEDKNKRFILYEDNILKENSKINCSLNIIYKYIRIWLLKMSYNSIFFFFILINKIIHDKNNLCEISSLVFNCVLSYNEHLYFWISKNAEIPSMPFIEADFTIENYDENLKDNKQKKNFKNNSKFIEIFTPFSMDKKEISYMVLESNEELLKLKGDQNTEIIHNNSYTNNLNTLNNSNNINVINDTNNNIYTFHNKKININYKIWRFMPCPFKNTYNEKLNILSKENDSILLSIKISSLPIKNLKDVYINNDSFIKFLVANKIDLNIAHQRVMKILQKYNLVPNYSLVTCQTILHISTFELLLKNS